jgi:DNA-binding NarL/FixJ family response regulator
MLSAVYTIAILGHPGFFFEGLIDFLNSNKLCSLKAFSTNIASFLEEIKNIRPIEFFIIDNSIKGYNLQLLALLSSAFPNTKIVIVGETDFEKKCKIIRSGVHGYFTRDLDRDTLLKALDQIRKEGYFHGSNIKIKKQAISFLSCSIILTEREFDFLRLICTDLTYSEIAQRMYVSPKTIDGYRSSLFDKFDVKSRTALVMSAIQMGILAIDDDFQGEN